jgi:hypothetical protein
MFHAVQRAKNAKHANNLAFAWFARFATLPIRKQAQAPAGALLTRQRTSAITLETMKRLPLLLLAITGLLAGCAHEYVMKLNNGQELMTASKPKLKGNTYHYKDAKGREITVPAGRVLEVEPASMAAEEHKPFEPSKPPSKKHWYFLWLA